MIMNYIKQAKTRYVKETKDMLRLSMTQCADLFGITYSEMADIIEGQKDASSKLIRACNIARNIFLKKHNT